MLQNLLDIFQLDNSTIALTNNMCQLARSQSSATIIDQFLHEVDLFVSILLYNMYIVSYICVLNLAFFFLLMTTQSLTRLGLT